MSYLGDLWDNLTTVRDVRLQKNVPLSVISNWLVIVCGFVLGIVAASYITQHFRLTSLALQVAITIILSLAISLSVETVSYELTYNDTRYTAWTIFCIIFLIITTIATYFYIATGYLSESTSSDKSQRIGIGILGGVGFKALLLLINFAIIPIIKGIPSLIFGIFVKGWWDRRKKGRTKYSK